MPGVEEEGDFTGSGLIDAVEAADDELRVAGHTAFHQVGELLQGLFAGHVQKHSEVSGQGHCCRDGTLKQNTTLQQPAKGCGPYCILP